MKAAWPAAFAIAATLTCASVAAKDCGSSDLPQLEAYESNSIGWTKDSDDVGFLDINLSLKYPIMPRCIASVLEDTRIYFAASVRFAQYLGTRDSSPVIGKRFNPKLIWRHVTKWDDHGAKPASERTCLGKKGKEGCEYIDLAFAHESNGQSIDSPELFRIQQEESRFTDGRPDFARDYISRGWDYLEVAGRKWLPAARNLRLDGSFRYFLPHGPLQGDAEEYFEWEQDAEGKPRRQVHGLAVLASTWLADGKVRLAAGYETGYSHPLRYNTFRFEAAATFWELPFMVFYKNGYANDLALYYKRASSVGVALELATF